MLNQDYKSVTGLEDTLVFRNQIAIDVLVDNLSKDNMLDILLSIIFKELKQYDLRLISDKEAHFITRRIMVLVFKGRSSYGDEYHEMIEAIIKKIKEYQNEELALLIVLTYKRFELEEVCFKDLDLDQQQYIIDEIYHSNKLVEQLAKDHYSSL